MSAVSVQGLVSSRVTDTLPTSVETVSPLAFTISPLIAPVKPDSFLFMLACYPISWSFTSLLFFLYYVSGKWLARCKKRMGFEV